MKVYVVVYYAKYGEDAQVVAVCSTLENAQQTIARIRPARPFEYGESYAIEIWDVDGAQSDTIEVRE